MRFELPWLWVCAPPLLVWVVWLARRSYAQLAPAARRSSLALRAALLTLLVAAAAQPAFERRSDAGHVLFLCDVSRSISAENLDAALERIDRLAREAAARGERVSVVAFGERPETVVREAARWDGWRDETRAQLRYAAALPELYQRRTAAITQGDTGDTRDRGDLEARIAAIERFRDAVAGERTDLESAVRLALNSGRAGERRTLYVFTDGWANRGRWGEAWNAAAAAGVTLHTVATDRPAPPEVAIADLAAPPSVRVNQGFSADLRIASTTATAAELRVFKDGFAQPPQTIALRAGENLLKLPGLFFREKGFHTVEAAVRAAADTQFANNAARALVVVPGEARVLYVDADEKQMPYLKSALELEGMRVDARPASGVPQALSELLSYDAFILSNVPADRLSRGQMQMIRSFVADCGGGFVMLGGDESFGLGGYYNTPIEEILPVRMPIQKDLLRPSLALMLVIDKSGSMDGVKIQLAKRAALASADAINPRDLIGVVGFDSTARVLLELTSAGDHATVSGHIAALDAGGGTFLYPALEAAHERLQESNARRKHVIILSDGQTEGFGYDELSHNMAADGITISTIGIGDGADMNLLEEIAAAGGGRAYFTNDFYSIPQLFTREALRASKSMLVERLVQPVAVGHDPALDEIDTGALPLLTGYVATTPKAAANLILAADNGDPLLAKWRFGLGWTAAFTSEPKPRWAEDWIEWEDFARFWSQLVRSVTGADLSQPLTIECSHVLGDDGVTLVAEVTTAGGDFADVQPELRALVAGGPPQELSVLRRGPGRYEAQAPPISYGKEQTFVWRVPLDGRAPATPASSRSAEPEFQSASYGFVYSFSPEFATLGVANETFERMAARRLGRHMTLDACPLELSRNASVAWVELWPALLVAALLLAPLDILVRRLG